MLIYIVKFILTLQRPKQFSDWYVYFELGSMKRGWHQRQTHSLPYMRRIQCVSCKRMAQRVVDTPGITDSWSCGSWLAAG